MPRRALPLALLTLALLPASASAANVVEDDYCSESGDYCQNVTKRDGVRYIQFQTSSLTGSMKLCVTPPGGKATCKTRKLRMDENGLSGVSFRWSTSFPRGGRGTYRARFSQGAFKAPVLRFKR